MDVEFGRGETLFALAQGFWDGPYEGAPAEPDGGLLVRGNGDGTFTVIASLGPAVWSRLTPQTTGGSVSRPHPLRTP
ncbi:hypothetical protein GCM10008955_33110 [Deinococcus malanensis]|uniref:Uncharacterized protein n=1 Tax=Deinococcus malanensis TaxID=1706855 RepID=A0ABQ2F0L6_9DEIO|nr:hypothetical protein GCM10008955_33110 [Deinococcus malanensis]